MSRPNSASPRPPSQGRAGGFTDWLPGAAEARRAIGDAFVNTFALWGYGLVATPLLEPLDTLAAGVGGRNQSQLFRFMDSDGSLLALVGERTVSVGRVVATHLHQGPFPLRLCYSGPVLKNQPLLGGRRRETMQAGAELIGHAGIDADAEVIAVAAAAVDQAGIDGVQIDVGHADFIPGLLAGAGLTDSVQRQVLDALSARDLVAVERALDGTGVGAAERTLLLTFPTLRGGREILDVAGRELTADRARAALDQLGQLWDRLTDFGLEDRIHLDLGAVRDWDYYTGPTFELFSGDLGFPLGAGGRYDSLLGRLGVAAPATGFVVFVDRCADVAARRNAPDRPRVVNVSYAHGRQAAALAATQTLRSEGIAATCALAPGDPGAAPFLHLGDATTEWSADSRTTDATAAGRGALGDGVMTLVETLR